LNQVDIIHAMGDMEWDDEDAEIFNQARATHAKAIGES
jgi:hypothetical protein